MLPIYTIDASQIAYVVLVDEITHDATRPFCSDPNCECHEDSDLVREHITKPLDNGLITNSEALRVYWCKQLVSAQDAAITDEEREQIMSEPSPLDAQVDGLDMSKRQWLSEHL